MGKPTREPCPRLQRPAGSALQPEDFCLQSCLCPHRVPVLGPARVRSAVTWISEAPQAGGTGMLKSREALCTGSQPPRACHTLTCGSLGRGDARGRWNPSLRPAQPAGGRKECRRHPGPSGDRQRPQSGTTPLDLGTKGKKKTPQNGQNRLTKSAASKFLQGFSCPATARRRLRGWRFLKYSLRSGGDPNPGRPTARRGSALASRRQSWARTPAGSAGASAASAPADCSCSSVSGDDNVDVPADSKRDYTGPGCASAVFSRYQACRHGATPEN